MTNIFSIDQAAALESLTANAARPEVLKANLMAADKKAPSEVHQLHAAVINAVLGEGTITPEQVMLTAIFHGKIQASSLNHDRENFRASYDRESRKALGSPDSAPAVETPAEDEKPKRAPRRRAAKPAAEKVEATA